MCDGRGERIRIEADSKFQSDSELMERDGEVVSERLTVIRKMLESNQ